MAETRTARFAIVRYSAGTDSFSRADFDESMQRIEERGAIYGQGLRSARPAAGTAGRYYLATDDKSVWADDGTGWSMVGKYVEDMLVRSSAAGVVAHTVRGFTGQTAALQEWRDGANAVKASVSASGAVTAASFSAPVGTITTLTATAVTTDSLDSDTGVFSVSAQSPVYRGVAVRDGGTGRRVNISDAGPSNIDNLIMPGSMMVWPLATLPDAGWIFARGQVVLRADYPALFARYGTTFNTGGELATQFRVPDLTEVSVIGVGGAYALNARGGSATKVIASGNLPAHAHTMAHTHDMGHNHPAFTTGSTSVAHVHAMPHTHTLAHTHDMGHGHTASATSTDVNHAHSFTVGGGGHEHQYMQNFDLANRAGGGLGTADNSYYWANTGGGGGHTHSGGTNGMDANQTHSHSISVTAFAGSTGGASVTTTSGVSTPNTSSADAAHTHTADVPAYAGSTGASSAANTGNGPGSSSPLDVMNPWVGMNWIIKT